MDTKCQGVYKKWLAKKVQTEKVKGCVLFNEKDIYKS